MTTLLVYDSKYDNTEKLAQAMAEALGTKAIRADAIPPTELTAVDLLVIGTPTHGGWFNEAIKTLLDSATSLEDLKTAAFDTRTFK